MGGDGREPRCHEAEKRWPLSVICHTLIILGTVVMFLASSFFCSFAQENQSRLEWKSTGIDDLGDHLITSENRIGTIQITVPIPSEPSRYAARNILVNAIIFLSIVNQITERNSMMHCRVTANLQKHMVLSFYVYTIGLPQGADAAMRCRRQVESVLLDEAFSDLDIRSAIQQSAELYARRQASLPRVEMFRGLDLAERIVAQKYSDRQMSHHELTVSAQDFTEHRIEEVRIWIVELRSQRGLYYERSPVSIADFDKLEDLASVTIQESNDLFLGKELETFFKSDLSGRERPNILGVLLVRLPGDPPREALQTIRKKYCQSDSFFSGVTSSDQYVNIICASVGTISTYSWFLVFWVDAGAHNGRQHMLETFKSIAGGFKGITK
jgi:hypothetical protein